LSNQSWLTSNTVDVFRRCLGAAEAWPF